MDLNDLFSKAGPALVFMLAVWFLTLLIRRVCERAFPGIAAKGTKWSDIVLPVLPLLLGTAFALVMKKFPILRDLPSTGTRAMYGFVAGAASGVVYRILKSIVKSKYGVELSIPPGAIQGAEVTITVPKSELPKIDVHPAKPEVELPDSQKPTDPAIDAPKGEDL
jgi:hypothetical protein